MEKMLKFVKDYLPMFRDSDAQGLIGIRAYLYYFQDMATEHLYHMGKGNDTLPETYGAAWLYTKYKMHVYKRADFSKLLHMETWIEKQDKLKIWQVLKVSVNDEIYALGRLESCVIHLKEQKIGLLADIEMPEDVVWEEKAALEPFSRIRRDLTGMEPVCTHRVQYSDLDKSQHMANLRYVNLMENAFSPAFYQKHEIQEMELHYAAQSFYQDEIQVSKKADGSNYTIAGSKTDGTIVMMGKIQFGDF